jgi:hypothetical protein
MRCVTSHGARLSRMQALKTQVKNGRVIVDEPTNLPEGAEVEVVVIDDELTTRYGWSLSSKEAAMAPFQEC